MKALIKPCFWRCCSACPGVAEQPASFPALFPASPSPPSLTSPPAPSSSTGAGLGTISCAGKPLPTNSRIESHNAGASIIVVEYASLPSTASRQRSVRQEKVFFVERRLQQGMSPYKSQGAHRSGDEFLVLITNMNNQASLRRCQDGRNVQP